MHILLIPSWYKNPQSPIVGSFFEEQARMFMKRGHQVGIISTQWSGSFMQNFRKGELNVAQDFIDNRLPTKYIHSNNLLPYFRNINYWYLAKLAAKKLSNYILTYGKPDLLHAHAALPGGIVTYYLSKWLKIPYVLTEHASPLILDKTYINQLDKVAIRKAYSYSRLNIAVSQFFADKLSLKYCKERKFKVIPNLVANHFFDGFQKKEISKEISFFAIGHLNENKNFGLLIKAIKELLSFNKKVSLKIAGEGRLKHELQKQINELKLEKHVELIGLISREEVKRNMQNSHAIVSTSKFESFGVNLIEGLACGRPVIATDSGGPSDIITHENGISVQDYSSKALAIAMQEMIENYAIYDQKIIQEDCIKRFSESVVASKLERVYSEVLRDNSL